MNPTYDFTGQVAPVTGGSWGMGLATARAFCRGRGAVVIADNPYGADRTGRPGSFGLPSRTWSTNYPT
jgi:NAD(P)-dependent dehydrogenase (short-subunit alcohol dehydrogenase family)